MRKYNRREKEFLTLLAKETENKLEIFSYFMQNDFFTKSSNLALAILPPRNAAILYIKKNVFDDLSSRKIETRNFVEILSLIEYLKQNRLIDIIPIPAPPDVTIHLMRADFNTPTIDPKSSDLLLNTNGLHIKNNDIGKIYDSKNQVVFEGVTLEKYTYELILNNFMGLLFVSEELKDYVKRRFKSVEDRRYRIGQIATWVSICIALIFGIYGIYNPFSKRDNKTQKIESQQLDSIMSQSRILNNNVEKILLELNKVAKEDSLLVNNKKY
jgi:hypothetical protein